eukprot:1702770-Rhodomonas_salina.3
MLTRASSRLSTREEALRLASDLSTAPRGTHRAGSAYTTRAPSDGIRNAFGATGREGAFQDASLRAGLREQGVAV